MEVGLVQTTLGFEGEGGGVAGAATSRRWARTMVGGSSG